MEVSEGHGEASVVFVINLSEDDRQDVESAPDKMSRHGNLEV